MAANSSTTSSAIGEAIKAHIKTTPPGQVADDVEPAQNPQAAGAGPTTAANGAASGGGTNAPAAPAAAGSSADDSASASALSGNPAQQAQQGQMLAADNAALAQSEAGANSDHATARPATTVTADSSGAAGAQNGGGTANTVTDSLPNFGFSAANAAQPTSAAAAASGSAASAPVPIAGLPVAIAARAQEGSNQFDIRLDPPELGRIDVRLDVDSNGQVTSQVTVDRPDTLALLQNQQPQLERALEQAGLNVADNGLSFTLRDQSFAGQNNGGSAQGGQTQLVIPDADLPVVAATQVYSRAGLGGGVDIRV